MTDRALWIAAFLLSWVGLGMLLPLVWWAAETEQWMAAYLCGAGAVLSSVAITSFWLQRKYDR
jgi:hypothetical protein